MKDKIKNKVLVGIATKNFNEGFGLGYEQAKQRFEKIINKVFNEVRNHKNDLNIFDYLEEKIKQKMKGEKLKNLKK